MEKADAAVALAALFLVLEPAAYENQTSVGAAYR